MIDIQIPGYEIIEQLGLGGMAKVYRARHINLDRDVAIKIMDAALNSDPTFAERFKREARIAARLTHPNIVQVYDVESFNDVNYLAMEYISSGDLIKIIRNPVDVYLIYQVMLQMTQALDYASSMGYVHRDIKPSNILVRENGSFVLADFGIARAAESSTQMTMTGSVIGTPSYMSPEQAQGRQLDGRSDLYSLAIVCFEMLTKELPYKADSSISTALKHLMEPIPTLQGNLAIFQPFFNRAMAKSPDDRFQSGAEMARALGQILDSEPGQTIIASRESALQTRPAYGSGVHTPIPPLGANTGNHGNTGDWPNQGTGQDRFSGGFPTAGQPTGEPSQGGIYPGSSGRPAALDANTGRSSTPSYLRPALDDDLSAYRNDYRSGKQKNASSGAGKWLGLAGLALLIGAGVATWFMLTPEKKQQLIAGFSTILPDVDKGGDSGQSAEELLASAATAYKSGKLFQPRGESAYDYYMQIVEADPNNQAAAQGLEQLLTTTVDRAMDYIDQGRLEIAKQKLDKAALIDASNAYLLSARKSLTTATNGAALREEKQRQVAELLERAGKQLESGKLLSPEKNNARDSFLAAIALDPDNEDALNGLKSITSTFLGRADIAVRKKQFDDAAQYLRIAGEISPNDPRIADYQRELLAARDADSEARVEPLPDDDAAADLAVINELLVEAQLSIARSHSDPDAQDRARMLLQEVLELDPENATAVEELAGLFERYMATAQREKEAGNYQAARRAFDGARAIDPTAQLDMPSGGVAELLQAGQAHEAEGNYREAVTLYLKALVAEPGNAEIDTSLHRIAASYVESIQTHLASGDIERATALQKEALRWFPNNAQLASILNDPQPAPSPGPATEETTVSKPVPKAPAQSDRPAVDEELAQLEDPEKIAKLFERAEAYVSEQKLFQPDGENAYTAYRQVLAIDADNAQAKQGLSQLAYISVQRVKDDLQADDIESARVHMADLKKVGASDMAIRLLDKKIRSKEAELAEQAAARKQLTDITDKAYHAIDNGDLDAARKLYKQAVALGSDKPDTSRLQADLVEAYHAVSRTALDEQNYNDAIVTAEQGLQLAPDNASLMSVKVDAETAQSTE